jgi:hypothetical protein
MTTAKKTLDVPLNFLLGISKESLQEYRLARMNAAANLRRQLLETIDQLIDEMLLVELAKWFEGQDRQSLFRAIASEEQAITWARRMIRGGGEILPRLRMSEEDARRHHAESAVRYQEANISEGKCMTCPEPLDRNSVRYCSKHLSEQRERKRGKSDMSDKAPHGRHPNSIAALARNREQRSSQSHEDGGEE